MVNNTTPNREFWIAVRAAHIRRAKLLQEERACLMEEIAAIERLIGIEPNERPRQVHINHNDNIAGTFTET